MAIKGKKYDNAIKHLSPDFSLFRKLKLGLLNIGSDKKIIGTKYIAR